MSIRVGVTVRVDLLDALYFEACSCVKGRHTILFIATNTVRVVWITRDAFRFAVRVSALSQITESLSTIKCETIRCRHALAHTRSINLKD